VERSSPLVRRVLAPNPSPWTLEGTNTWLVGLRAPLVIDPGPAIEAHLDAILEAAGEVRAILLTHTHRDHAEGALAFAVRAKAPLAVVQPAANPSLCAGAEVLTDGQLIVADGATLTVVTTPGHSSDHAAFWLEEERAMFTGDHVLGRGTTVVVHPDGDMRAYLASLERVRALDPVRIYPGHGPILDDPVPVLDFYRRHRLEREATVLAALDGTPRTLDDLLPSTYRDVPAEVLPAAKMSLAAHLDKLVADGLAFEEAGAWRR
jgi:glyoxylase-like metal-dependent hydrolase (beta-lactamase superfamily II)